MDTSAFEASPGVGTPIAQYQTSMDRFTTLLGETSIFTLVRNETNRSTTVDSVLYNEVASAWPKISYQVAAERPASECHEQLARKSCY